MNNKRFEAILNRYKELNDKCREELNSIKEKDPELAELMKQAKSSSFDNFGIYLKENEMQKLRLFKYIIDLNGLCSDAIKFGLDTMVCTCKAPPELKKNNTNFDVN